MSDTATPARRALIHPDVARYRRAGAGELYRLPGQDLCLEITEHLHEIGVLLHHLYDECCREGYLSWDINGNEIFDLQRVGNHMYTRIKALDELMHRCQERQQGRNADKAYFASLRQKATGGTEPCP